jgi:hypothetical protein
VISFPSATGPGGNKLGGFVCPDHMPGNVWPEFLGTNNTISCRFNPRHPFGRDISASKPGMHVLLGHAELFGQSGLASCVFDCF